MRRVVLLFCGVWMVCVVSSCVHPKPAETTAAYRPAPATSFSEAVPYAKLVNQAFGGDIDGRRIQTACTFLTTEGGGYGYETVAKLTGKAPPDAVFFSTGSPDGGAGQPYSCAFMRKAQSDVLFTLKKGQRIKLSGRGIAGGTGGSCSYVEVDRIEPQP